MSRSSIAIVNLRAVVILIVLAFHSVLPYLASLPPAAYQFDSAPYQWLAFPIVDSQRWFGFDLFCAWQDVGLMSLMFFLSGLFVPSSLGRKGSWKFLSDRLLRIGIPFVLAVIFLAPLAYYPTYRATAVDPSLNAYWQHWLALPFWPNGPQWFLGQLLAFNVLAVAMHRFVPGWDQRLVRLVAFAGGNPVRFFVVLVTISALAYVPWRWPIHPSHGRISVQSRFSSAGRCTTSSISLQVWRSGLTASNAACLPAMVFWRGAGRRGSPQPLSASCSGPRRPP